MRAWLRSIAPPLLFWSVLSGMTLMSGPAASYTITVSPKPPTGPGVGKIVMATAGSATVVVTPTSAMTITGGSAVFLAAGGAVSTSGTASPTAPQMTVACASTCGTRTINVTIQAAGGGTGPAVTVTSFSVSTVSCTGCTFGSPSGTSILTLPIHTTGNATATFKVGMTVTFNPASVSGNSTVPFSVSAQ
jgi:hypothetical protein